MRSHAICVCVYLHPYSICSDLSSMPYVCARCVSVNGLVLLLSFSFNQSLRRSFVTVDSWQHTFYLCACVRVFSVCVCIAEECYC